MVEKTFLMLYTLGSHPELSLLRSFRIEDSQFISVIHAFLEKYTQTGNSLFDSLGLKI